MTAVARDERANESPLRWLLLAPLAALLVLLLILLMHWMIRAPEGDGLGRQQDENPQLVRVEPPEQQKQDQDPSAAKLPEMAQPPPPSAPPSLARPTLPSIAGGIPITVPQVEVANVGIGAANLAAGMGLGNSGTFGGFAGGGGNGNGGGGGGGFGRGEGFSGKELVPLSTARPQMPDWACKQKIKGWVEVVFIVAPGGNVENVRLVDASPKGVYEAAAIESVSHWIYEKSKVAREVKQRVAMDPEDCAYNYNQ